MIIKIGTLNVHEWSNRSNECTEDEIIKLLSSYDLDIIGIQETNEKHLEKICKKLGSLNFLYSRKTALLSKYSIKKKSPDKTKEKYISADIRISDEIDPINVTCIHLDYMYEPKRLKEFDNIMNNSSNSYGIWIGDFNALTENDYSKKEMAKITEQRKSSKWEEPHFNLTNKIISHHTNGYKLYDVRLNARKVLGPLYTCRFNTRIDYIYVNGKVINSFIIKEVLHVNAMPFATDHNLVIAKLELNKN